MLACGPGRSTPGTVRAGVLLGILVVLLFSLTSVYYLHPDLEARLRYHFADDSAAAWSPSSGAAQADGHSADLVSTVPNDEPLNAVDAPEAEPEPLLDLEELEPEANAPAFDDSLEAPALDDNLDNLDNLDAPAAADDAPDPRLTTVGYPKGPHRELVSLASPDGSYSKLDIDGYNPNIIPHPVHDDTYIVVAQHNPVFVEHTEHTCLAKFSPNGTLACQHASVEVPVPLSIKGNCTGNNAVMNDFGGPRDARLAYGPTAPYLVYGSQSQSICLGLWAQDFRALSEERFPDDPDAQPWFTAPTELGNPVHHGPMDKNFFLFWDDAGAAHVHTSFYPTRVFARLGLDGSAPTDLAPAVAAHDQACVAALFPPVRRGDESPWDGENIHQATNSLALTLCDRADASCAPAPSNTFVMTILHKKNTRHLHTTYEPFLALFDQRAPFGMHAVSQQPYWIRGRKRMQDEADDETGTPAHEPEMVYITSLSWAGRGQRYHGHVDDDIFVGFGIEDGRAGLVRVKARDLVMDLAMCGDD